MGLPLDCIRIVVQGAVARFGGAPRSAVPYGGDCADCRESWLVGWDEADFMLRGTEDGEES